jgi:hypothetical protein
MKIVNTLLIALVGYLLLAKVILPQLVSANSDAAIIAAVTIVFVVVWYVIYGMFNYIKENDEK